MLPASTPGGKKLTFAYDYVGRRVQENVFTLDGDPAVWNTTAETDLRFVYDQWNVRDN